MKEYSALVTYSATITDLVVVEAENSKEAKQKIEDNYIDDIIDTEEERDEVINIEIRNEYEREDT